MTRYTRPTQTDKYKQLKSKALELNNLLTPFLISENRNEVIRIRTELNNTIAELLKIDINK